MIMFQVFYDLVEIALQPNFIEQNLNAGSMQVPKKLAVCHRFQTMRIFCNAQLRFSCSKSTTETLEKGVKHVQS